MSVWSARASQQAFPGTAIITEATGGCINSSSLRHTLFLILSFHSTDLYRSKATLEFVMPCFLSKQMSKKNITDPPIWTQLEQEVKTPDKCRIQVERINLVPLPFFRLVSNDLMCDISLSRAYFTVTKPSLWYMWSWSSEVWWYYSGSLPWSPFLCALYSSSVESFAKRINTMKSHTCSESDQLLSLNLSLYHYIYSLG